MLRPGKYINYGAPQGSLLYDLFYEKKTCGGLTMHLSNTYCG